MTAAYRVILVDDHVLVRQGLKTIIEAKGDLEVVAEADDAVQLLDLLRRLIADLVVLDISMPHLRGIEAIHEIRAIRPEIRILVLTMHRDMDMLAAAMSAGAGGYILKEDAVEHLYSGIAKIKEGGMYVSPKLADEVTASWATSLRDERSQDSPQEPLTVREREVLKLTAEGKSSRQIADLLHISPRTAEHHRASIMRKLNLKGTAALVQYAMANDYL